MDALLSNMYYQSILLDKYGGMDKKNTDFCIIISPGRQKTCLLVLILVGVLCNALSKVHSAAPVGAIVGIRRGRYQYNI